MQGHSLVVKALPVRDVAEHRAGACDACGGPLRAMFPVVRGRDSARDEDSFFFDRFCSHACYHAYGRRVSSAAAVARWN